MKITSAFIASLLISLLISCGVSHDMQSMNSGDEGGIGGTGMLAQESGLGGTGIIGEVTGFGSIFVNGEELELDKHTQLFVDGEPVRSRDFSRGEVVSARAVNRGQQIFAREIYLRHEVIGSVQKVMANGNLIILGQTVVVGTHFAPQPEQQVRVSGFRDNQGVIHASYIGSLDSPQNLLVGQLQRDGNGWHIGGQMLKLSIDSRLQQGQMLRVRGRLNAGVLQVSQWSAVDALPFKKPVSKLLVQGFVQNINPAEYRIAGRMFSSSALQSPLLQQQSKLLRLELQGGSGEWKMLRLLVPENLPMGKASAVPANRMRPMQRPGSKRMPMFMNSMPGRNMH